MERKETEMNNPQNPDATEDLRKARASPVVIYGPPGSGKTQYAPKLAKFYGKTKIIDDWGNGTPTEDALYLTQWKHIGAISIDHALDAIGLLRKVDPEIDLVNHPPHYKSHPSGIECITIAEHFNFCLGNAIKYIWHAGEKGSQLEDLKKARWYLDREIRRIEDAKLP